MMDSVAQYYSFKNRIINGDMRIDQRNAGASGTATAYTVDRFAYQGLQTNKITWGQNLGGANFSSSGFPNYLGATSSSAYTVLTGDLFRFYQQIEGLNIADLAWGTASAAAVTLSFRVYSSLTGTFGGALTNSAGNRSYPFTYSIPVANTLTTISVTIPGDTTGTWLTTNGIGITVSFSLGAGSTYSGTAGAWAAGNFTSATGATSVVGTNGATFYITGVQLEKGVTATSFDYRPYTTELQLCQRYYTKETGYNCKIGSRYGANQVYLSYFTPVEMRSTPSVASSNVYWYVQNTTASEQSLTSTIGSILSYVGGNVDVLINTSFNPAAYIYFVTTNAPTTNITFTAEL
jgi:hypothetical protein